MNYGPEPADRPTGQPAKPNREETKMSIELKQNLDELKVKLEHLRSYL
jgi:hypothetical protein